MNLYKKAQKFFWQSFFLPYKVYIAYKGHKIRKQEKIRVLFVVAELGPWKTEELFLRMRENLRFEPILGITESIEVEGAKELLKRYIESKKYPYVDLDYSKYSINRIKPDLIFYYKPYDTSYRCEHIFKKHISALPCVISYGFETLGTPIYLRHQIDKYAWYIFVENEIVRAKKKEMLGWRTNNLVATGIPMQDSLSMSKEKYNDPWKDNSGRKRIIYAPHHSIKGYNSNGIEYATFFEYCDFIFELAQKYSEKIVIAFKPHPRLYPNLVKIWGKEKTDMYYRKWKCLENGQLEMGEYTGLFMHSDAMIHDCGTFTVEYHFTKNPVLFLVGEGHNCDELNDFGKKAFDMHYLGYTKDDVEKFINNVIDGIDPRYEERNAFYEECLLPHNGKKACENIMNIILGKKE